MGPFLGTIPAIAGSDDTGVHGAALLAVYSLGLGVPFIVAALAVESFAAFLARFRAYLGVVEKAMGGLLVLTGIAFFAGWVPDAGSWLLQAFPDLGKLAM
jgi:cytochrome c-type biogenesis protein